MGFGLGLAGGRILLPQSSIEFAQSVSVDAVGQTLGVVEFAQSVTVAGVGTTASAVTALDPLTIAPGWEIFLVGDVGLGDVAGTLTWADQSGNTRPATMATAGTKPTVATLINGRQGITFDGSDDHMIVAGWDPPAPGTSSIWLFSVWVLNANTVGKNLYAGGSTSCLRLLVNTGPVMAKTNGTARGTIPAPTTGVWQCSEDYYSNSAADYYRIGATSQTVATAGNTDCAAGVFRLGASNGGGLGSPNGSMVCFGARLGLPSAPVIASLRSWVTGWYGATVAV